MLFTMPALLTRMSGGPSSAVHVATAATTAAGVGHVDGDRRRAPAELGDRGRRRHLLLRTRHPLAQAVPALALERFGVDVGDGDVGAGIGEGEGDRPPDAPGGPGDEGDATGERHGIGHVGRP